MPLAVDDDVPAEYPKLDDWKLTLAPDVENALSPDADVLGVVPEVTTTPTMDNPVAGALLSTLTVKADSEFHVPAKTSS